MLTRLIPLLFFAAAHPAFAEEASFERLQCSSVISSDLRLSSPGGDVALSYEARGSELRPLLRSVLSPSIPGSLVRAYRCIELEAKVPQSACSFADDSPGTLTCAARNVGLKLTARLSCYDEDADIYDLDAADLAFATEEFLGEGGRGYFRLRGEVTLASGEAISLRTEAYRAHDWGYDGRTQQPECSVDGAPIRL